MQRGYTPPGPSVATEARNDQMKARRRCRGGAGPAGAPSLVFTGRSALDVN